MPSLKKVEEAAELQFATVDNAEPNAMNATDTFACLKHCYANVFDKIVMSAMWTAMFGVNSFFDILTNNEAFYNKYGVHSTSIGSLSH